jgi:hypothetical protein
MADLASIGIALGSVKTLFDLAKNAQDTQLAMKISTEVANIQGQLIDLQQRTLSIQQENQELRSEVDRLKSFTHHHSVAWRKKPDGTDDGPFCPVCVGRGRDMRLTLVPQVDQSRGFWMVFCTEAHQPRLGMQAAPGPFYDVPKELLPENYFFMRPNAKTTI